MYPAWFPARARCPGEACGSPHRPRSPSSGLSPQLRFPWAPSWGPHWPRPGNPRSHQEKPSWTGGAAAAGRPGGDSPRPSLGGGTKVAFIVSHAAAVPGPRQASRGERWRPRRVLRAPHSRAWHPGALWMDQGPAGSSSRGQEGAGPRPGTARTLLGGKNAGMEQVAAGRAVAGALLARVRAKGSG